MKTNNINKTFEVEFESTTYRRYYIDATSESEALKVAKHELEEDVDTSIEWKKNSTLSLPKVD